jgi:hypothetical protein
MHTARPDAWNSNFLCRCCISNNTERLTICCTSFSTTHCWWWWTLWTFVILNVKISKFYLFTICKLWTFKTYTCIFGTSCILPSLNACRGWLDCVSHSLAMQVASPARLWKWNSRRLDLNIFCLCSSSLFFVFCLLTYMFFRHETPWSRRFEKRTAAQTLNLFAFYGTRRVILFTTAR